MTNNDKILGTIRTGVPALVGTAFAWLIGRIPAVNDIIVWLGENAGIEVQALVSGVATAGVIALYYALVRYLGDKWPWLEVFLGSKKTPAVYAEKPATREK